MNRSKNSLLLFLLLASLTISCKNSSEPALFKKLAPEQTKITFANNLPDDDSTNILDYLYYYNGGGVAAGDVNNDGKTDLYFVSNRGANKLYLNKGSMAFEDITDKAGVAGKSNWKTGVTMADVNGDGWLDIYVCAVGKYKGISGANELYINNQNGTFTERAAEYGLDFKGFSTQATFFDYDKDGDLDCYLLTHAVHSVSSYDKVSSRSLRDGEAGDYLFRNGPPAPDGGVKNNSPIGGGGAFTDVSKESGIYGAAMGYGLGIVTADINNDGWDDIYVSNDFHEDDYYYINQKNGNGSSPRFKEEVKQHFKHLSKYSMGCDVADVNNDGYLDVFTSDMHSPDETTEKLSLGEDAYDIYLYKLQFGFYNQYSRNCLQISQRGEKFSDISPMAGVSATDWSWSPLLADFDNDGVKDLFVSNGIPHRPNNLDYLKFLSSGIDSMINHSVPVFAQKSTDKKAIEQMPDGKAPNFIFKGTDGWKFEDKSKAWGFDAPTVSNGAIYADLDNDGDLDIITNDLNAPAALYQNNANEIYPDTHYLSVKLAGNTKNTQGIGAKLMIKTGQTTQYLQQQPTRGFLSSVDPVLHFGLGQTQVIDSLVVIWPDQKVQILTKVKANQILTIKQADAQNGSFAYPFGTTPAPLLAEIPNAITASHQENDFIDFIREPLIPFLASTEGPKLAVGDVNNDGLDDIYQCGARNKAGQLLLQKPDATFVLNRQTALEADSTCEDTDALFFDADGDKDLDLYVVSGGNEYLEGMEEIRDRLYLNDGRGNFTKKTNAIPAGHFPNKSCVKPCDFDKDGDIDLFVGGRVVSFKYGAVPISFLYVNEGKGKFSDQTDQLAPELRNAGLITDAIWADTDQDGDQDLITVGEWTGIQIWKNEKGKLETLNSIAAANRLETHTGLWHSIEAADFDKDGDVDFVVGNLGTNTKYIKEANPKLRMYANDMDGNGKLEQIVAYEINGDWFPAASRDDLARMAPGIINKRFPKYTKYAGKPIEQLFEKMELNGPNALQYEVNTFESVYVENKGKGEFDVRPLPREAQISKVFAMRAIDVNKDGYLDVLMGGNLYGASTYQGRYDASYGLVLLGSKTGFKSLMPLDAGFVLDGEVRDIKPVKTATGTIIAVSRNNRTPQVFKFLR